MKTYLEVEVPEELCQHLFTSFKRKICQASPEAQRQSPGIPQFGALGEPALPLLLGARGGDTVPVVAQGQGPRWGHWVQPQRGCHSLDPCHRLPPALLCTRKDGAFPGMGDPGGFVALIPPLPPRAQSQSHLMLASPSRPRWPEPLSQVPMLVATRCAAPVQSGVVGWGLSTRPDGSVPCLVDLQRVETSAESYLNCKTDKKSLPWCTRRMCQPPAQRRSFPRDAVGATSRAGGWGAAVVQDPQ